MSLTLQPWMQPGLNYTDINSASAFCSQDGGSWNATGKWCTPLPGGNVAELQSNATSHNHLFISYNKASRPLPTRILVYIVTVLIILSSAVSATPLDKSQLTLRSNATPQDHPQPCIKYAARVGDGNPHPSCRWKQVTGNLDCKGGSCTVSHLESRTVDWSVGINGNAVGKNGLTFGSVGFGVSESYTTGNTYSCNANAGQRVCVTAMIGYTDYTVTERARSGECQSLYTDPYIIYAPNNYGQQYYRCHHDSNCHDLDWERWDHGIDCQSV